MKNSSLDAALRGLDAASASPVVADAALLDRIVAADVDPPRRSRRLLLIPVAAAAVAAGVVLLPGGGGNAYASWTPTPATLTPAEVSLVEPVCREQLEPGFERLGVPHTRLVLAERRGDYVAMLFRNENPEMSGSCLVRNRPGSDDVDDVKWGAGGGSGPAASAPARGFTEGTISDFRDASFTDGAVGADVVGMTIRAGRMTVAATVRDGRYVAWWPGKALNMQDNRAESIINYDLTLSDGTVIRDAAPSR